VVAQKKKKLKLRIGPNATAPKFRPYLRDRSRHLLLWGGRDSTKSDFAALELLLDCMQLPYFLCVLIREKQNTIADSQIATLKKVAEREGLAKYFRFPQGPSGVLEVSCLLNKNKFIGRGTDDMDRMKSVSDPTCAWYEEANQIAKEDADVVSTTLRTSRAGAIIREIYSFNPDHKEDYKKFWIWKKFFDETGHPNDTTFDGQLVVDIDGQLVQQSFRVLHSTAQDNPWCPLDRKATYKGYELTDPYRYRVWWLGLWATKETGNEFYPAFKRGQHVKPTTYLPRLPILQSWDANSLPYCAMLCAQQEAVPGGLHIRIFQEYALRSPNSGLGTTARKFLLDRTAKGWANSDVLLTGDATLRKRNTGDGNQSDFKDVVANMLPALNSRSVNLWPRSNTRVMASRDFVNYVLRGGLPGITVQIDEACVELIADMELSQLGIDGIFKEMYNDKELGVRYQLRGHFADIVRYLLVTLLKAEYEAFLAVREG
jgi:hypothetical protein